MLTACASTSAVDWSPSGTQINQNRLHLNYGPIDLLIDIDGSESAIFDAHQAARETFEGVLETLVSELVVLRKAVKPNAVGPDGPVAQRMWQACLPHASRFVTPMAAVAGAVADHTLMGIVKAVPTLNRVWVNNGGDIALMLGVGQETSVAVCRNDGARSANIRLQSEHGVGGIATSGWRGRSHSLGIADSVTVLAPTAASADVAATLIANAVCLSSKELDRRYITRTAAVELQPDSDLADAEVTVAVSVLPEEQRDAALQNGAIAAEQLITEAPIIGVFIECQGHSVSLGECS